MPLAVPAPSPELLWWLALAVKLSLAAGIVVAASLVVERAGPLVGALVVTLPVTVWPAYAFLALDHDAAFLARSAQSGLAVNAASAVFMLLYAMLAQRGGVVRSVCVALAGWIGAALLLRTVDWSPVEGALLNLAVYAACIALARRYRDAPVPRRPRAWYELPLRALLVGALVGAVLVLGTTAGPAATGLVAVYPISTTCTMLILHPRIGGRASAAVIANGLWGLFGIGWGLFALTAAVEPLGVGAGLALALAVPVAWNASVWAARRSSFFRWQA